MFELVRPSSPRQTGDHRRRGLARCSRAMTAAVGSIALVALASRARADSYQSWSPMACQPRAADRSKVDIDYNKGIFNNSTTGAAKVFCSIPSVDLAEGSND